MQALNPLKSFLISSWLLVSVCRNHGRIGRGWHWAHCKATLQNYVLSYSGSGEHHLSPQDSSWAFIRRSLDQKKQAWGGEHKKVTHNGTRDRHLVAANAPTTRCHMVYKASDHKVWVVSFAQKNDSSFFATLTLELHPTRISKHSNILLLSFCMDLKADIM